MTAKSIYDAVLTELNKLQAPSITLEDFNHFFNKAINQYINRRYNIYDVNQQTTDDLRVLKSTSVLTPEKAGIYEKNDKDDDDDEYAALMNAVYGATYEVNLPDDYLHILNCVCIFKVNSQFKCYNKGDYVKFGATHLTADMWSKIINNFYMQPSYKRPYFYIHNVNTSVQTPTNPIVLNDKQQIESGTDYSKGKVSEGSTPKAAVYHKGIAVHPKDYESDKNTIITSEVPNGTLEINPQLPNADFYMLQIPNTWEITKITDSLGNDQTELYTNRMYVTNLVTTINQMNYKIIFLGTGSPMPGTFTITFNE